MSDDDVPESPDLPEPFDGVFTDLAEALPSEPKWIIRDLIPVGLTFIAGPPKSLKSTLTMVVSALVGRYTSKVLPPYLQQVERFGTVMWWSFEATASELKHMAEEELDIKLHPPRASILVADDPWTFRLDDKEGQQFLMHWLSERKPTVVILDPLRNFHETDENDSGEMTRLLKDFRRWAMDNEAAFIVVHHTSKVERGTLVDASNMRGTSALLGMADGSLTLTPMSEEDPVIHYKAKFKKGKAWSKTLELAAYTYRDRQGTEQLSDIDAKVLRAYKEMPEASQEEVRDKLKVSKQKVVESVATLKRNGLLP